MARMSPLDPERFDGDSNLLRSSMDRADLPEAYRHLYSTDVRHVHRTLAHNPTLLAAFREYNSAVWHESGLDQRERELVILTIARETESRYEWHQHVRHGLSVGLTEEEIRAVPNADAFAGREAALVAYARAFARGDVDDAVHEALLEYTDESTVIGIGALAAGYLGLAHLLDAVDIEPEEPFVGWDLAGV